jgi:isoleucyl-tRNA synthetase
MEALVRWMAPITSFTAQELWEVMPGEREEFVFTQTWYDALPSVSKQTLDNTFWQQIMLVKADVNSALEKARISKLIGGSLEAKVTLYVDTPTADLLSKLEDELRFVLITSEAHVKDLAQKPLGALDTPNQHMFVLVEKLADEKCVRCWHHKKEVGSDPTHPQLCNRCIENVDGNGEARQYA